MSRNLDQFITKITERLGPYYSGVAPFLARLPKNSDRDDIDLLTEPPESYVGNMLALGILNRLYQKEFAQTTHRVLVLPECVKDYAVFYLKAKRWVRRSRGRSSSICHSRLA